MDEQEVRDLNLIASFLHSMGQMENQMEYYRDRTYEISERADGRTKEEYIRRAGIIQENIEKFRNQQAEVLSLYHSSK